MGDSVLGPDPNDAAGRLADATGGGDEEDPSAGPIRDFPDREASAGP